MDPDSKAIFQLLLNSIHCCVYVCGISEKEFALESWIHGNKNTTTQFIDIMCKYIVVAFSNEK